MAPNIFSCDPEWFKKLKDSQEKVVIASWCGGDEKCNQWLEKLAKLENEGLPVFVCDINSCPSIAESIKVTSPGETVVFSGGEEKGRLVPGEDFESDLKRVKELAE